MGMNRVDEIGELSRVLRPKYAVITNIGTAHIGILGSRENIAAEKKKIFSLFDKSCYAFIPAKDDYSQYLSKDVNGHVIEYGGESDKNIVFEEDCGLDGVKFSVNGISMRLNIPGMYNYRNACAAIRVALTLGLTAEDIKSGISEIKPIFGRSQVLTGRYTIIQDCYNANPDSMEKALDFCSSVKYDSKKFFVLGDMLELGASSKEEHSKIGAIVAASNADVVIFVGEEMKYAYESAKGDSNNNNNGTKSFLYFAGYSQDVIEKVYDTITKNAKDGDMILLKASRGIGLERLTKLLLGRQ